ncbi:MAG: hypothetical protein JNM84_05730 [Planctomycetes bacterium]|nr:hypothetical protein [Planctomycetota bacterium]
MTIPSLRLRQVLLVLSFFACVCFAIGDLHANAPQGTSSAEASIDTQGSEEVEGAGMSGPLPASTEPWYSSQLAWTVGVILVALLAFALSRLLRARLSTAQQEALQGLGSSMVPACITFGPLFMTRIAGTASNDASTTLVFTGVLMLSFGLGTMYSTIESQRRTIAQLRAERETAA